MRSRDINRSFCAWRNRRDGVKEQYGEFQCILQISNYIGFMIEEAVERGFTDILIGGFVGKLVKVASGTMNTHSHVADGRIETICTRSSSWRASFSHTKAVFLPYNEGGNEDCGRRGTYGYLAGYGTKSI